MSLFRGNLQSGAVRDWHITEKVNCTGEGQYEERECSKFALTASSQRSQAATETFCPGRRVNVTFLRYFNVTDMRRILVGPDPASDVLRHIPIQQYTAVQPVLIFPPGLHHDMFAPQGLIDNYLSLLLAAVRRVPAAAAVVVGIHSGSMAPNMPTAYTVRQFPVSIARFNHALFCYARAQGVAYLDTAAVTAGHPSLDGVHLRIQLNFHKAQLLLAWLDSCLATVAAVPPPWPAADQPSSAPESKVLRADASRDAASTGALGLTVAEIAGWGRFPGEQSDRR